MQKDVLTLYAWSPVTIQKTILFSSLSLLKTEKVQYGFMLNPFPKADHKEKTVYRDYNTQYKIKIITSRLSKYKRTVHKIQCQMRYFTTTLRRNNWDQLNVNKLRELK